jgi:hypothetical protein
METKESLKLPIRVALKVLVCMESSGLTLRSYFARIAAASLGDIGGCSFMRLSHKR